MKARLRFGPAMAAALVMTALFPAPRKSGELSIGLVIAKTRRSPFSAEWLEAASEQAEEAGVELIP